MRLSRFFVNELLTLGELELPESIAHYMGRVLRLPLGARVQLFDGSGFEFVGTISEISKKKLKVSLQEKITGLNESPIYTHLGQGLARGEKMDFVIQKATELGVNEITPLITERCEVRLSDARADKRLIHWQQIAISACEQSGRTKIPLVHRPIMLDDWLAKTQADCKLMLNPIAESISDAKDPSSVALLIGPEGGFSEGEIGKARRYEFKSIRLGNRVLRTETAPIVALAMVQQKWGDF